MELWIEQGIPELALSSATQAALRAQLTGSLPSGSALQFFGLQDAQTVRSSATEGQAVLLIAGTGGAPITPISGFGGPAGLMPIDEELRTLNWIPDDAVVRACMAMFQTPSATYALPYSLNVVRISVPSDVAGRLGIGASANWTLDAFVAAVDKAATLYPQMPTLGGAFHTLALAGTNLTVEIPTFVWMPFVYGFGGELVDARHQINVTSAQAISGLDVLVNLVGGATAGAVGLFNLWGQDPRPGFLDLPFPRMPVKPVLPFLTYGWGIAASARMSHDAALEAARWLTQLYLPAASQALAGSGITLATQSVFEHQPVGGYQVSNLSAPESMLPVETDGSRSYLQAIGEAIAEGVRDTTRLESALSSVEQSANARLAPNVGSR